MAPNNTNIAPDTVRKIRSLITSSQTIPPTASLIKSTAYVNGRNGLIIWKNSGSNTTGYVPPDPEICSTSNTMAIAFPTSPNTDRSEEHTSELQSRGHLVCRLLLEKKKKH